MEQRTCSVGGCEEPAWARGWCSRHYQAWRRRGDPLGVAPKAICGIPGCGKKHKALGRCNAHYLEWRKENVPRPECSFADCGKPVDSHGLCAGHAQQLRRGWELVPLKPERADTCTIAGCTDPHQGLGYCNRHLIRFHKHGDPLKVRQKGEGWRKYSLDEAFFDEITTEAQAYWLGFITADGNVMRNDHVSTMRVALAARDTAHLERMNADLGSDRPLVYWDRKFPATVASFDSWRLVQGLRRLGIHPHKSGTVEPWDGPADLMPHYWRGLFDGDGSIFRCKTRSNWVLGISGSEPCVREFGKWGREVCGSRGLARLHLGHTWAWTVSGGPKPQLLSRALYGNATVYLQRKYELACELDAAVFLSMRDRLVA